MESKGVNTFKKFFSILQNEKKEIGNIYFYSILNGLVQLTLPLGLQSIISFVIAGNVSTSLVLMIAMVIVGFFVSGLLQVNQMKIIEKIQQQLFVRYSFQYAYTIPNLNLKEVNGYYLPEMVNRIFDTISLQKGISKLLLDTPVATIQIVFGLLLLSFYHPVFIIFGLALLLVVYLIISNSGSRAMETSIQESDYKYKVAGLLEELARVVTTFKFSKNTSYHLKKTDQYVTGYLKYRTAHFRILLFQYWTLISFKIAISILLLVVGAYLLINQQLNIGEFIAAEILILMVISSVEKIVVNLDNVYDVFTALEKVNKIIDKPVESNGSIPLEKSTDGMTIQVNDVSFAYKKAEYILKDISLEIKSGEKVCITGPYGAGKSTLLRLMSGAYQDFEGAILINGRPIQNYEVDTLRSATGILLNIQEIFDGTLWDNIAIGDDGLSITEVDRIAAIVGLTSFINTHPQGYHMHLQPGGDHLPGKVVKKILLVRALVQHPRLLLLEEPFTGIEDEHATRLASYIFKEIKATTVLLVSNENEVKAMCDKVVKLNKGIIETVTVK